MFEHALTICAVCLVFALVRALRRAHVPGSGYALFVAALLALTVVATVEQSRVLGIAAIALSVAGVLAPWLLEHAVRWAFVRSRMGWAVRLLGLRATLMPGSGLGREHEILRGLAILEARGVEEALAHFRTLAQTADSGTLLVIHEQILSMLFYGHRWDEGISYYESRFDPGYAALRPPLALGLLRAYGESGKIENAASLLRAVEEGPAGRDLGALEFLSRARLLFLAYAGAVGPVARAVADKGRGYLGLSPAYGSLMRGIALARSGHEAQAREALEAVPNLAGPADERAVAASRENLATIEERQLQVPEELSTYVLAVARRLDAFLSVAPQLPRPRRLYAATLLAVGVLTMEVLRQVLGGGGLSLLVLGALTPEMWHAGQWTRALTGLWLTGQPVSAVFHAYVLFMAGRFVERVCGAGRLWLVGLGGGAMAMLAGLLGARESTSLGGASLMAVAVVVGALMLLPASRTPTLSQVARRAWTVMLLLMLFGLLIGDVLDGFALSVPAVGLWVATLWAMVVVAVVPGHGVVARSANLLGWVLLPVLLVGAAQLATSRPIDLLRQRVRTIVVAQAVTLDIPEHLERVAAATDPRVPLPILEGWIDDNARRTGSLVQIVAGPAAPKRPIALADERLFAQVFPRSVPVPEPFDACSTPGDTLAFELYRDGEPIGITIERRGVGHDRGVALLFAPIGVVDTDGQLYADILCSMQTDP